MWLGVALVALSGVTSSASSEQIQFENGLRIYLEPMPGRATVAVLVGYRAGAASAPPGRYGLPHLAEHLVLRRAGRYGPFASSEYLRDSGGRWNGFTAPHRTWYESTTTPVSLDAVLLFERERMAFTASALTEEDLSREKDVVVRELELREGYSRKVLRAINRVIYPEGSMWVAVASERGEVQRHTIDELRWFLRKHYRPDQAVVAIAGRFDKEALRTKLELWFSELERPEAPPASYAPPPLVEARDIEGFRIKSRNREEQLEYRWQLPNRTSPGERQVVEYILEGLAGRVRRAHKGVARRGNAEVERMGSYDLYRLWISSWASKRLDGAEATFKEKLDAAARDPDELVKSRIESGRVEAELRERRQLATPTERARVAMHALLDDEAPSLPERVDQIRGVSAARAAMLIKSLLAEPPIILRSSRHNGRVEIQEVQSED